MKRKLQVVGVGWPLKKSGKTTNAITGIKAGLNFIKNFMFSMNLGIAASVAAVA